MRWWEKRGEEVEGIPLSQRPEQGSESLPAGLGGLACGGGWVKGHLSGM